MEPVEPTNIRGNVLKYCMFGIKTNQLSRKCTDGRKGIRTVKYVIINLGLLWSVLMNGIDQIKDQMNGHQTG